MGRAGQGGGGETGLFLIVYIERVKIEGEMAHSNEEASQASGEDSPCGTTQHVTFT